MNFIIRNITLGELDSFKNSDEYRSLNFVPISRIRAVSHQNNPRADKSDCSLFLAYNNETLIGYLGAISDWMYENTTKLKVYWLSCMWVLPEYRRHGIALKLLQHSNQVFEGKVLITNFIPRSKAAFDKTGMFTEYSTLSGIRAYVRFDLENILKRRSTVFQKIAPLLKLSDALLNLPVWLKLKINISNFSTNCKVENIDSFDNKLSDFIQEQIADSTFRRGTEEFNWIINNPWVKRVNKISSEAAKYYFSQEGKDFRQWFLKVEKNDSIIGFLVLTLHKAELKTPYVLYDEKYVSEIAAIIGRLIIKEKVNTYISYNEKVNKALRESGLFLHVRKSEYGFLISNELKQTLSEKLPKLYEGDGDGAFT